MNRKSSQLSRKKFIRDVSTIGFGAFAFQGISAFSCSNNSNQPANEKNMKDEKQKGKLGIALVGLGSYSSSQLAPALLETKHCFLSGIVTGTPSKAETYKEKYNLPEKNIYNYQNFDSIKDNPDLDIIYIVLPNSMHAEYTIRAAKAGKHVICEKPMAVTVKDCDEMIAACKKAGKMLSIGYRLHFDPYNIEMMRLGQKKIYGNIKKLKAEHGMSSASGWRLNKELAGGGPLMDVGIYCVQGLRYTTGLEPISVTAKEAPKLDPVKYKEVEETLHWQFEFPGGITSEAMTSYTQRSNILRAEAEKGWFEISPAFGYGGLRGKTSDGIIEYPRMNQQAAQMDDFAQAVINKRPTPVPGEMGRQDVKILQAIYKAMETGSKVII